MRKIPSGRALLVALPWLALAVSCGSGSADDGAGALEGDEPDSGSSGVTSSSGASSSSSSSSSGAPSGSSSGSSGTDAAVDATADTGPDEEFDAGDADAGDADAGDASVPSTDLVLPTTGVCAPGGFCAINPFPSRNSLYSVWGTSSADVWMVGDGALLHYDGTTFTGLLGQSYSRVVGVSPGNTWLFGGTEGAYQWTGTKWSALSRAHVPPSANYWFRNESDGWAVGNGTWHWDGAAWTAVPSGTIFPLEDVFGFASDDVWAVGGAIVRHWNGAAWTAPPAPFPPNATASKIFGVAPNDMWAWGSGKHHFDGTSWTTLSTSTNEGTPRSISGTTGDNVYFLGSTDSSRWNGVTFQNDPQPAGCSGNQVWTSPSGDRFIVGDRGLGISAGCQALRRSPNQINSLVRYFGLGDNLTGLSRVGADDYFVRSGSILKRGSFSSRNFAPVVWGADDRSSVLLAGGPGEFWVSGTGPAIGRWNGAGFDLFSGGIGALTYHSGTVTWALNGGQAAFWNGNSWTTRGYVGDVTAIWGDSATNAWAVGNGIYHWNGNTWSNASAAQATSVWGVSANEVYAASSTGTILHWNGNVWAKQFEGTLPELTSFVWYGANDIYALESALPLNEWQVRHWDGQSWVSENTTYTRQPGNPPLRFNALANDNGELWAVGDNSFTMKKPRQAP